MVFEVELEFAIVIVAVESSTVDWVEVDLRKSSLTMAAVEFETVECNTSASLRKTSQLLD
jgi:hypothetical protein